MRLIDASTLKKVILEHRNDYIEDNFFWSKLFELIDNAPTIVVTTKLQFKERNNENGKLQRRKG